MNVFFLYSVFLVIELATLGGEAATAGMLKKASRDALELMPDASKSEIQLKKAEQELKKLADITDEAADIATDTSKLTGELYERFIQSQQVAKRYQKLIENIDALKPFSSILKGNIGEIKTELHFLTKEWTFGNNTGRFVRLHKHEITDLYEAGRKGIDHVFEFTNPPPKYFVVESKYRTNFTGIPRLDKLVDGTIQMSWDWITDPLRFESALSKADVSRILNAADNELKLVLSKVDQSDVITLYEIDKTNVNNIKRIIL
ncbi:MAG: hypothetical protein JNK66_07160 [Chitinophagales bacterium]|nr:hypothetical protein [Chitinophagales bacterium]